MIEVLAGDIKKGLTIIVDGKVNTRSTFLKREYTPIKSFEVITEENQKRFMVAAGWAAIGTMVFGPLGGLAGVVLGGNRKEIMVAVELEDGRRFMGKCSPKDIPSLYTSSDGTERKSFVARWEDSAKARMSEKWEELQEKRAVEQAQRKEERQKELDIILGRAPRE